MCKVFVHLKLQNMNTKPDQSMDSRNLRSFYGTAPQGDSLKDAYEVISASKKLIDQMEKKKYNGYINKSIKKIDNPKGQKKRLTTRQKLQGTLKTIANNSTIAHELLDQKTPQNKTNYLQIVEKMYSHKQQKRKKPRRNYEQDINSTKKRRTHNFQEGQTNQPLKRNKGVRYDRQQKQSSSKIMDEYNYSMKKGNQDNMSIRLYGQEQLDFSISDSDDDELIIGVNLGKYNERSIKNLRLQIQKEIQSYRSNNKIQDTKSQVKNQHKEQQQDKEQDMYMDQDKDKDKDQNQERINYQKDRNFQKKQSQSVSNQKKQNKKKLAAYSFREPDSEDDNGLVPQEILSHGSQQQVDINSDHGTGLNQQKIKYLLDSITKRINYSSAVIEGVKLEHERSDNNQLQIDSRFSKETKLRDQLNKKISWYYKQRNWFDRCQYKRPVRYFQNWIAEDQSGKKSFVNQIWKSPGKSTPSPSFISLRTPQRNGLSCCSPKINKTTFDFKRRNMMESRLASNINSNGKVREIIYKKETDSDSENENQYQFDNQNGCMMKQNRWAMIEGIRKTLIDHENTY